MDAERGVLLADRGAARLVVEIDGRLDGGRRVGSQDQCDEEPRGERRDGFGAT